MATLTTQVINRAGKAVQTVSAAVGGDAMECGPGMMLHLVNVSGGPITVTLAVPASRTLVNGVAITSLAVVVANNTAPWIGPIDGLTFMDPTTGLCTVTYSSVTSVSVAAAQLSQP